MKFTHHPTTFLDAEVSLFANTKSTNPIKTITFRDWIFKGNESLRNKINRIRAEQNSELKQTLPCITGSGVVTGSRTDNNLKYHNGCIVLDVDYKENLHLEEEHFLHLKKKVFSKLSEICYAGHSVGGKGYYLIIMIENPNRHKEYFEYLSKWFKYAEDINIDKTCKNLSRLRYYSIDDNPYINENAIILKESFSIKILKSVISKKTYSSENDLTILVEKIEASGISIAPSYDRYFSLAVVFYNELGQSGRDLFHRVCKPDPSYDYKHCDNLFNDVSKREYSGYSIRTLIYYMKENGIRILK